MKYDPEIPNFRYQISKQANATVKLIALCFGDYLLIPSPMNDCLTANVPESAGWHLWLWRGARALKPAAPLHIVLSATQQNQGLRCKIQPRAAALSRRQTGQVRGLMVDKLDSHANIALAKFGLDLSLLWYIWSNDQQPGGQTLRYNDHSCSRGELRVRPDCNFSEVLSYCVRYFKWIVLKWFDKRLHDFSNSTTP